MEGHPALIQIMKRPPEPAVEQCELCGVGVDAEHGHVIDMAQRSLVCVCRACHLLFVHDADSGTRFRSVPRRYQRLPEFSQVSGDWEALGIPISLMFFLRSSETGRTTAFYPSPAGAVQSELPLDAWSALATAVPELSTMVADVEALLVRRRDPGPGTLEALIVPIDACYELVGRIRRAWSGLQGGDLVWDEVDRFVATAMERAQAS